MAAPSNLFKRIQPLLEASFSRHQERLREELTRLHNILSLQGLCHSRANLSLTHEAYEKDMEARLSTILEIVKSTVATVKGNSSSEDAQELKAFVRMRLDSHIRESGKKLQEQATLLGLQPYDRFALDADRILVALDAELEIVLRTIDRPT